MAQEASKARARVEKWLVGPDGLDVGCGNDPILPNARRWDLEDGDAQMLEGIPDCCMDWVFSAHCLEHMRDPLEALLNWWRVVKPGGHMVVIGPDEDLYEQGVWPSIFNSDHKLTLTLSKDRSWSPVSRSLVELVRHLPSRKLLSLTIQDSGYKYDGGVWDRTMAGAEAAVELVVQKQPAQLAGCKTPLDQILVCPKCSGSLTVSGKQGTVWHMRCSRCGVPGTVNV